MQQLIESLSVQFGERLEQRLPENVAAPDDLEIGRVRQVVDEIGSAQDGDRHRRLPKELRERGPLLDDAGPQATQLECASTRVPATRGR